MQGACVVTAAMVSGTSQLRDHQDSCSEDLAAGLWGSGEGTRGEGQSERPEAQGKRCWAGRVFSLSVLVRDVAEWTGFQIGTFKIFKDKLSV